MTQQVSLPCVLQIGFAGARNLWGDHDFAEPEEDRMQELRKHLVEALKEMPKRFEQVAAQGRTAPAYFCCGISQVAIGGDRLFTDVCASEKIPQRIFLPQVRTDYLNAIGSDGKTPDFEEADRTEAIRQLGLPHIIQELVVSGSRDRRERFSEVNVEIVRVSDAVIGIVTEEQVHAKGGTEEMLRMAERRGRLVARIVIQRRDGKLNVETRWTAPSKDRVITYWPMLDDVTTHTTPIVVDSSDVNGARLSTPVFDLPSIGSFTDAVKKKASPLAKATRTYFEGAVRIILFTHVAATILATLALILHHHLHGHEAGCACSFPFWCSAEWIKAGLILMLGVEFGLLIHGFRTHHKMKGDEASRQWADARLLAEICRSVLATKPSSRCDLSHLLNLPIPKEFRPLLRTMNVLQLIAIRHDTHPTWQQAQSDYVMDRLVDEKNGQLVYYTRTSAQEHKAELRLNRLFLGFTGLAIGAVLVEFALPMLGHTVSSVWSGMLSFLAISMPVVAVGVLSWSSSRDYAARTATYEDMCKFLSVQVPRLRQAATQAEFKQLMRVTEQRLLSENLRWYARAHHKEVA